MEKELGLIGNVALDEIWKNEPEFTRWLSEEASLAKLGEELGLELSLIQVEADVGDFSADIFATERSKNEKVIIENQFGTTDHDHLGKILTYASGLGASYVIWIFEDIREEHRQAIDWLNEHTTEDVSFFAVKLELWQIDGSKPALKFDIICRPNDWAKTVKRQSGQEEPSEGKLRQLDFWSSLRSYAIEKKIQISFRAPRPQHWYDLSIGSGRAHLSLTVNTQKRLVGCSLYISDDKELFQCLEKDRSAIEKELGTKLDWKITKGKASYVTQFHLNFDISDESSYPKIFDWMLDRVSAFKKTFAHRVDACNTVL